MVIDASAVVEVLRRSSIGKRVANELRRRTVRAPELLDVEVLSALKGLERAGALSRAGAGRAAEEFFRMPVTRASHASLVPLVWELRHRLSVYDAFYVAVAQMADCPVLTTDARWGGAGDLGISVICIG